MPNNNPIFVATPRIQTTITTAASSRDGDGGTYNLLVNPGPNGSRIERVTAIVAGTNSSASTAMSLRLYIKDVDTDVLYLFREALLPASTPSNLVLGSNNTFTFNGGLCLGTQSQLYVGSTIGDTGANRVSWVAELGDF
jgi:hypothetical protein